MAGFGVVWFANANNPNALIGTLLIGVAIFFVLMVTHAKTKFELGVAQARLKVNEEESLRLSLNIKSLDDGAEFYDQFHPYHEDLDIYGKHSIFQLVNRTTTLYGRKVLAKWLNGPASHDTILERQQAQIELKDKLDLRQNFQAFGLLFKEKTNIHIQEVRFEFIMSYC